MLIKKPVGRAGGALKYDLLTILSVHALGQGKTLQRQTLRLICLITARYNWQNDHLSVGQSEIARLWSVDTRTVKREMAAFRARGWLVEKRAAARGRVTVYGLGIAHILADTRASWDAIGPDLVARLLPEPQTPGTSNPDPHMAGQEGGPEARKVIPFPQGPVPDGPVSEGPVPEGAVPEGQGAWARVALRLQAEDANIYRAWVAPLEVTEQGADIWLRAPSAFHATYLRTHHRTRLETALAQEAPGMRLHLH
ncbi:MAG: hypothetical protein ACXIU7_07945 [Roseinatronobacter sp.]